MLLFYVQYVHVSQDVYKEIGIAYYYDINQFIIIYVGHILCLIYQ